MNSENEYHNFCVFDLVSDLLIDVNVDTDANVKVNVTENVVANDENVKNENFDYFVDFLKNKSQKSKIKNDRHKMD